MKDTSRWPPRHILTSLRQFGGIPTSSFIESQKRCSAQVLTGEVKSPKAANHLHGHTQTRVRKGLSSITGRGARGIMDFAASRPLQRPNLRRLPRNRARLSVAQRTRNVNLLNGRKFVSCRTESARN